MKRYLWILIVALVACKNSGGISNAQLGTLKGSGSNLSIKTPVTKLARVPGNLGEIDKAFGICFDYANGSSLGKMRIVMHTPAPLTTVRLPGGEHPKPNQVILDVPSLSGSGTYCQDMYFDADDPLGTWTFDLERDGKSLQHWNLEVTAT
ncbi:MAG: hypothetical protein R3B07_02460 [Polyangiaceae bacterium]